jgi:hypothetical protein
MRWLPPIVISTVTVMVMACTIPAGSDTSTSTTGDAGSTCPQTTTCEECSTCALNGGCATLWATCEASSDCQAIDQCYANCGTGDAACHANCQADSPNGMSDYQAVNDCVHCTECPTACAGQCGT